MEGYAIQIIKKAQQTFFNGEETVVFTVRNASKEDFINAAKYGGENTVVINIGHQKGDTVTFVDGNITNEDIGDVQQPLKALVQHTCGKEGDEIGKGRAKQIFGRNRKT